MASMKNKHNHALTNWLKVIIFAIVMIAPFFAVFAGTAYTVFNKNAYQSYYGETINQETYKYVENNETLKTDKKYYLIINQSYTYPTSGVNGNLYIENFKLIDRISLNDTEVESIKQHENQMFRIYFTNYNNQNTTQLYYVDDQEDSHWLLSTNRVFKIEFNYLTSNTDTDTYIKPYIFTIEYNNYSYLSSSFYYNVEQLKTQPLFSWTKDTGIYGTFNAMCQGLDQQDGILPLLLTYWTLNTCIYIVFDIILVTFTKITHMISRSD